MKNQFSKAETHTLQYSSKIKNKYYKHAENIYKAYQNGIEDIKSLKVPWSVIDLLKEMKVKPASNATVKVLSEIVSVLMAKKGHKLLENKEFIGALYNISRNRDKWIREIHNWKPGNRNVGRQISHFLRFLFAKYPVPTFMDEAFLKNQETHIKWFIHIGQGGNIRKVQALPFPLTKKMAHYFIQAPNQCTIHEALRFGQVLGLGGDRILARYILASNLGRSFENVEFWQSFIQFLINNPAMDKNQIDPIIDYIRYQKFASRRVYGGQGEIVQIDPPQPNFSMKGRTVNTLLKATEEWHKSLGQERELVGATWKPHQIPDFELIENKGKKNEKVYRIQQLLTGPELQAEGSKLHHCVASYAYDCKHGQVSIWSLNVTFNDPIGTHKKLITIEVNRKHDKIVQIRGKYNRWANKMEMDIIEQWAMETGLSFSNWV